MRYFFLSCVLVAAMSCNENRTASANISDADSVIFSKDQFVRDVQVLASDSFMGRKPFTEGEVKTIAYLQQRLKEVGVEAGNNGTYLQNVPMVNIETKADSFMQVQSPKGNFTLKGFDDYVIWTEKPDSVISLDKAELVFAGYGVNAPERNWNDYKDLNVKGKIVLVMVNDPGYGIDSSLFKGDTMTYYGRWTYKFEEAARQGAKGCLVIHNTKAASYPFSVVQNNWNGSRLHIDNRGKEVKYCDMVGWVSEDAAHRLLQAAGYDSSLLRKAAVPGFKAVPLHEQLTTRIQVKATYDVSHNVVGKITGTKHPEEYIIYSAHWDHLGIGKPDETGDSIYNGALDNASATAGLLQLAAAFKNMKTPVERTIVFLFVTAEEQGLWGSAYYAQNPIFPLKQTLANINMDGINILGLTNDITIVGKGQSDLEDYLEEAAKKVNRVISFETHPEAGYYYRSDHFNFAKVGVPALYTSEGIDVIGKGKSYGKEMSEAYTAKHYHRPSDEYNDSWNVQGAMEDLRLVFMVGNRLASEENWPGWKTGSEFRQIRETSLAK